MDNSSIGFSYTVTREQIDAHRKKSVEEVLQWLDETYRFVTMFQTEKERNAKFIFKGKKYGIHTPEH